MIISLCIPVMNRAQVLKQALPVIVTAVNESPPIEIVILDYSSTDDLRGYLHDISAQTLGAGNFWTLASLPGKKYYNAVSRADVGEAADGSGDAQDLSGKLREGNFDSERRNRLGEAGMSDPLISLCIPCHGRTYDLKNTLPQDIVAANASPPVEIVILDYSSPDDLWEYIDFVQDTIPLKGGSFLTYQKSSGHAHYHMAHARNLSVRAASGEYVVMFSTDLAPTPRFFPIVRGAIASTHPAWLYPDKMAGVTVVQKTEFIATGGFDERFEYYGPEDQDLVARLRRRGGAYEVLPSGMIDVIYTPKEEKIRHYRGGLGSREMHRLMNPIFEQNCRDQVLVANQGKDWGR